MDDMWCSLDTDIPGLHSALAGPFWPDFADCAPTPIADDNACFDVALMASTDKMSMDASRFLSGHGDDFMLQSSATSSLSSKRSLSIDSGGSSASFSFEAALAAANAGSAHPAPARRPFAAPEEHDDDDAAIMRAMMAVISSSSTSPASSNSPSASSGQPFSPDGMQQAAMSSQPRGGGNGQVMVRSSLAVAPERTSSLGSSGGRGQQQEDPRTAGGNNNNGQLYHMMSERKRREKLNDSFHSLRSLLPPCSKKDKTTVLTNAASYLRTLEAQVSELEEKKTKLEKHIPAATGARGAHQQRAKVQISKEQAQVNLTVMVMVECDVAELVLRVLECLRWMKQVSVLSVDADTYSPQVLLKAIASIKLRITDDWNEASFREAMTKAVNDATSSSAMRAACARGVGPCGES